MQHPTLLRPEQHPSSADHLPGFAALQLQAEPPCRSLKQPSPVRRSLVAVTILGLGLTGCFAGSSGAPRPRSALSRCPGTVAARAGSPVVVVTATSAEPRPDLSAGVIAALGEAAHRDDACVTVVGPDGITDTYWLTPHRNADEVERGPRRHTEEAAAVDAVRAAVQRSAARSPGLDLRTALTRATRNHPRPTTAYVISSGLSTIDPVDLRRLGWDTDGTALGDTLRAGRWLPDLTGWTVVFVGLGDVAGTQPALPDPLRERLVEFWLGMCRSAGAASCTADPEFVGRAAPTSTNVVPVVDAPAPRVTADATWLPTSALFAVGRADVDPDADRILRAVADRVRTSGRAVTVVGHTDAVTGTPAVNRELSTRRAFAVRARLIALGVAPELVVEAVGVGSSGVDPAAERRDPRLVDRHRAVEIRFGGRSDR